MPVYMQQQSSCNLVRVIQQIGLHKKLELISHPSSLASHAPSSTERERKTRIRTYRATGVLNPGWQIQTVSEVWRQSKKKEKKKVKL